MSNADVLAILENRLERLSALKEYVIERETLAEDAEARSFSLPSPSATDKLQRYEAHVDRNSLAAWTNWTFATATQRRKRAPASQHQSG
jgi:hypothetical protein